MELYFTSFLEINVDVINDLTNEALYTLKQFLYEDYLSVSQIAHILQKTEFKAAPNHVKEKIDKFLKLGLIKKIKSFTSLPKSRHNNITSRYYKLTSIGLFYVLKKIEINDVREDPIIDCRVKIFNTYRNDPLFRIFIYNLIGKELLYRITDGVILWKIVNYIKQVCQVIDKELKLFREFYKNGKIEDHGIRWNYSLKNDRAKWNEFCHGLIGSVILVPFYPRINSSDSIAHTCVSSNSLSFECDNTKYSIEIDEHNSRAKLLRNDREYRNISIKKTPNCFILYRTEYRDKRDYLLSRLPRYCHSVEHLKLQFGFSILQLFNKPSETDLYFLSEYESDKKYYSILKELAKDKGIRQLINEINNDFREHYDEFIRNSE